MGNQTRLYTGPLNTQLPDLEENHEYNAVNKGRERTVRRNMVHIRSIWLGVLRDGDGEGAILDA